MISTTTSGFSGSRSIACFASSVCASARRLPRVPRTIVITSSTSSITRADTQSLLKDSSFLQLDPTRLQNPGHVSRSDYHTHPLLFFAHRVSAQRSTGENPDHKRRHHRDDEPQAQRRAESQDQ